MRILISGASGFVGRALCDRLTTADHTVVRLTRSSGANDSDAIEWDPEQGVLEQSALEGFDAVIHLAGEPIVGVRWTAAKMARIRESRIAGTQLLSETLARLEQKPRVLLSASAIGFYGNRGDAELRERSGPGSGFLPEVCRYWETAADPARRAGIRLALLRIGLVLGPEGGALEHMSRPFRLGVGGVMGNGRQYMSWIALDDAVEAMRFIIEHEELSGPINLTAPNPVTNRVFTRALGKALHRPTVVPLPAFMARTIFGDMADALLLASARVLPARLQEAGFTFQHPELEGALEAALHTDD